MQSIAAKKVDLHHDMNEKKVLIQKSLDQIRKKKGSINDIYSERFIQDIILEKDEEEFESPLVTNRSELRLKQSNNASTHLEMPSTLKKGPLTTSNKQLRQQ